jgi:alpha-mannosidase
LLDLINILIVLLNQFHDVLPGSSIGLVYIDAEQIYADVWSKGNELLESALSVLYPSSSPLSSTSGSTSNSTPSLFAVELTSTPNRRELVKVPIDVARAEKLSMIQLCHDNNTAYVLFENDTAHDLIEPMSMRKFDQIRPRHARGSFIFSSQEIRS